MTNVLISSNPWKGSLRSPQVNREIAQVLHRRFPKWTIETRPLSDGGDGFLDAVAASYPDAKRLRFYNAGPMPGQRLLCEYLWSAKEKTLFLEAAEFHGMRRLPKPMQAKNMQTGMKTSSAAVGKALISLRQYHPDAKDVIITVGGSASTDGGSGFLQALGWRFYDANGYVIRRTMNAQQLLNVSRIEPADLPKDFPNVILLVDVESRYREAPSKFGPQKGITPVQVTQLEKAFDRMSELLGPDAQKLAQQPGTGAAGGLGFGVALVGFKSFSMQSGMDWVAKNTALDKAINKADLIITGEGRFDQTSLLGKGPGYLIQQARRRDIPVAVLCGQNALGDPENPRMKIIPKIIPMYPASASITRRELAPAATRKKIRAVLNENAAAIGALLDCKG